MTLNSFDAALAGKAVKLTWVTNTEIDNSGFNLYRKGKNGPLQKLNAVLIAAQQPGSSSGHTYTYLDKTVKPGQTYAYYLDDVSMEGVPTRHGPVEITLPKGK